jgi:DNA-binding response OmpR family regulator
MRVLVIEDEKTTAELLSAALLDEGWETAWESDGERGLCLALRGGFDALVLDIMLPSRDGLSVVRQLRAQGRQTPVLMLSARGELEQRVQGLDAGADDYLPKPFARSELVARIRSITRRSATATQWLLADLSYDAGTRDVKRDGQRIELSTRECRLLECLLRASGAVVSRRDIIAAVWGYDFDPGTNLVDVYIRRLRIKLDAPGRAPLLHTVRGLGYMMSSQS